MSGADDDGRANGRDGALPATGAADDEDVPSAELVDSLRDAIDRRDRRIARLEESLESEAGSARALRRELDTLKARLDRLEREPAGDERPQRGEGPRDVEVSVPHGRRVGPAPRAAADADASSEVDDAIESALAAAARAGRDADDARDAHEFIETVADIPDEMLSPELMVTRADTDGRDAAAKRAATGPALMSLDEDPPRRYALAGAVVTIGRSSVADVMVDGRLVSRLHARIRIEDGRAEIEDLGSTNGIEVNAERVARAELADGDEIHLGRARFRFVVDGE